MADDSQTRKNCLQWGLRILTPKAYFALLRRFAVKLSPDAYEQIKKAHMGKRGGAWWYQWLTCQIIKEMKWINLGTGARIADWHWDKIATFLSWESYEDFREELRGEVSKRLRDNPL
jgi:hypothetical protein